MLSKRETDRSKVKKKREKVYVQLKSKYKSSCGQPQINVVLSILTNSAQELRSKKKTSGNFQRLRKKWRKKVSGHSNVDNLESLCDKRSCLI